jgi:hypothetical protein
MGAACMSDEADITVSSDLVVTVETEPKVTWEGYIRLTDWKGELCSVDATFDLSGVPPGLVDTVIGAIQAGRQSWHLGDMVRPRPPRGALAVTERSGGELSVADESEGRLSLWQRVKQKVSRG